MKNFSKIVLAIALFVMGVFVTACGKPQNKEIKLSESEVVINLTEEVTSATITAELVGINVDALSFSYDNTCFWVSAKKTANQMFEITVASRGEIGCDDVEVIVYAGASVTAKFKVTIVVPVVDIKTTEGISVAFDGTEKVVNLYGTLTFSPENTKQTGVTFEIYNRDEQTYVTEIEGYAKISGNYLVISENYDNFDNDIVVVVSSSHNSEIRKEFSVKVIPNTIYLANQVTMLVETNAADNYNALTQDCNLTIQNAELQTFKVLAYFPKTAGLVIDVDANVDQQNNVMQYLNVQKRTYEEDYSGDGVVDLVNEFTFTSSNLKSAQARLYFKFSYAAEGLKNNTSLQSNFVKLGEDVASFVNVNISVPVTGLTVLDKGVVSNQKEFTIYKSYVEGMAGTEIVVSTMPLNSTEQTLIIQTIEGVKVLVKSEAGTGYKQLSEADEFKGGTSLFISGEGSELSGKLVICSKFNLETNIELTFNIKNGATGLGFAIDKDPDASTSAVKDIAVECGDDVGAVVLLYAPGANLDDLIYPTDLTISPDGDGYFSVLVKSSLVGEFSHTIKTSNGFKVILNVQSIQTLTAIDVAIKSTDSNVEGIGKYSTEGGSLATLSMKYGYNIPLEIIQNENANISSIKFYFVDAVLGDEVYPNVYAGEYKNFEFKNLADYKTASSVIDAALLKNSHIIGTGAEGKVKVRVVVAGYKVQNGVVVPAGYDESGNEITEEIVEKTFFVEVYRASKDITSTSKTIEIRAENEIDDKYFSEATKTVNLSVVADGDARFESSYNRVYIDGGQFKDEGGEPCIEYVWGNAGSGLYYIAKLWVNTNQLEINAKSIPDNTKDYYPQVLRLFVADFYVIDGKYSLATIKQNYSVITYEVNVNIIATKRVEDIKITSLKLENEAVDQNGGIVKTYERIYLDTLSVVSGSTNVYKIVTEVLPISAFDKSLEYTFVPDINVAGGLVDVSSNDGMIYYSGSFGGTGKIYIKPADPKGNNVTLVVPIVVADGNSEKTAYEISNLNQIVNPNKHYRLKTAVTLSVGRTLFANDVFLGGLYGEHASIQLHNCSLFNIIGENAVVENLTLYGTASGTGFVAKENSGTIKNVNVVAYVGSKGYVPSVLNAPFNETEVGGLVGVNKEEGKIIDSSFAGTIIANKDATIGGLVGDDKTADAGITNSFVVTANYEFLTENKDYLITTDNVNYTNGIILVSYDATGKEVGEKTFKEFEDHLKTPVYLSKSEYINTTSEHSIGKSGYNYGIVYYYKAKDASQQEEVEEFNQIPITNYTYTDPFTGTTKNVTGLINSTISNLRVLVYNMDGTKCNFVSVSGNFLYVRGTGLFKIEIFSEFNYLESVTFEMLSIYYMSDFGIYSGNDKHEPNDTITFLKGFKKSIQSKATEEVNGIKLENNDFGVILEFNTLDASDYITGNVLGNHTINASFEGSEELTVSLDTKMGGKFNSLLNEIFCNGYKLTINAINGTTNIQTTQKEGIIEPKDGIVIDAIITTDNIVDGSTTDYIDETTIYITNDTGYTYTTAEMLEIFDVYVSEPIKVEFATNQFKFQINVSLKDGVRHLANYVNRTYNIRICASSDAISDNFDAYAEFILTINNQSLSNIQTTIYNFTSYNGDTAYVQKEPPVSVISPDDSALLVVDLFPSYTSFDYVEISATSSTLAGLAFRVRDRVGNSYNPNTTSRVEALTQSNGIRIYNKFNEGLNSQYIGSYYVEIWTINTLETDTVFTINVSAYLNGEKLNKTSAITLYVNAPERPEISINGETTIYAYPGEEFIANISIASDQSIADATLVNDSGEEIEFTRSLQKLVSETESNITNYLLKFTVPEDQTTAKHLILTIKSEKYENGSLMQTESSIYIFMMDFKAPEGSIKIAGEIDGVYKASSIKYTSLSLYTDLVAKLDASGKNAAIDKFNQDYYYKNTSTEFEFGLNYGNKAYNLLANLYYVNGNTYSPIAIFDSTGRFVRFAVSDYNKYISFSLIEKEGGELVLSVKGKEQAGEVPMALRMYYTVMGNLSQTTFEYVHNFTIVNTIYTTEDMPIEIASAETFLKMQESEEAYDYILNSDIYLYEHEIISDTDKIKSLDGNNYTIYIMSFKQTVDTNVSYSLFNSISSTTTIKNLTVSYYYLNEITLLEEVMEAKIAGLAIVNNGVIYNSEVMVFAGAEKSPTHNTFGLKVATSEVATTNINVAGFVLENRNSITHSRVGGVEKKITKFTDDTENPTLITKTATNEMFTIRAGGTISGFVYQNNGVIASSYAKNIHIVNTYNKNQTVASSGFVNSNQGTISMSYVEGAKTIGSVQALGGGIEASGILAGFVYSNISKITDCYSNIMLHTPSGQVGRLGAGFVYYNGPEAIIAKSYSFSSIAGGNTTQLNFSGITELMQYNNFGRIENCYYYANEDMKAEAVEDLFYTNITSVENVADQLNFYGFSFASKDDAGFESTWTITNEGPRLTSADDIAYSIRYKTENPDKESILDYLFIYDENYTLGTKTNPIIIRDAIEFNGVFGGYKNTNTDIENCFDTVSKKVYGAYRLVNNISFLDLIIEDNEEDSNYKYNLSSTAYTLSGKYKDIANKPGSFNGNGLTISDLAISNEETTGGENYGLFKTIEAGASFANVNIVLAKGGIKADNTTFVGTIAGTLSDSALVNVDISSNSEEDHTDVIGSNIVGGAVGRVIKNSYVFGVNVNNISVISTYYEFQGIASNETTHTLDNNMYKRLETNHKNRSIAGGVFGVVDCYTPEQESEAIVDVETITFANIQSLKTKGSMTIEAMTVGGVIGYVGQNVVAKDLSLTISKTLTKQAKLISYYCFAGGIVGFNLGYLYQIKAEHDDAWQKQIETTMDEYYGATSAEERAKIDRGNVELFIANGENAYAPGAIGGLVGVMANGTIEVAYSKLHVINEKALYAGGIAGFVNKKSGIISIKTKDYADSISEFSEVYATGDVYAGAEGKPSTVKAYSGGIVGYSGNGSELYTKVNALNYWGDTVLKEPSDGSDSKYVFSQIAYCINDEITSKVGELGIIKEVKFADQESAKQVMRLRANVDISEEDKDERYTEIQSYFGYTGVSADSGARVDVPFVNNSWYYTNWERKNTELYPKIRYTNPTSIFEIFSKEDFGLFDKHGDNPNAVFVVTNQAPIDCTGVSRIYPILRGTLVGLYSTSGFTNMTNTLFRKITGKVTSLNFDHCTAPLGITAEDNAIFSYLNYTFCNFQKVGVVNNDRCIAGVVYKVNPNKVTFDNINISDSKIKHSQQTQSVNAGILFAISTGETGVASETKRVVIEKVNIANAGIEVSAKETGQNDQTNIGVVFGAAANVEMQLVNVDVKDNDSEEAKTNYINLHSDEYTETKQTSIGYVGGSVQKAVMTNCMVNSADLAVEAKTTCGDIYIGGIIGLGTNVEIKVSNNEYSNIYDARIEFNTPNTSSAEETRIKNVFVGGIAGNIITKIVFNVECEENLLVGSTNSNITINAPDAIAALFVGGALGNAKGIETSSTRYIKCSGDIIINGQNGTAATDTNDLSVGGFIGAILSEAATINRIIVDGAIAINENINSVLYVGGVIGKINASGKTIKIGSLYTLGDIIASNIGLDITKTVFVGGLIGQISAGNVAFNKDCYSLTTIVDKKEFQDDAGNLLVMSDAVATGTANIEKDSSLAEGLNPKIYYASNLNICVSNITNENIINQTYEFITGELSVQKLAEDEYLIRALGVGSNQNKGTKLNAVKYSEIYQNLKADPNGSFIISNIINTSLSGEHGVSIKGLMLRKTYVVFDWDETQKLDYAFNKLENVVLFADGQVVYSEKRFINNIEKDAVVSGIILRSDIRQAAASFAHKNDGVVYVCSVEAPLDFFSNDGFNVQEIQTLFTSKLTSPTDNVAGFIFQNNGYIFGSHSNVSITVSKTVKVAGFVYENKGFIEYSYANGSLSTDVDTATIELELFANSEDGTVENCYTLFADTVGLKSVSLTLCSGCYYEPDSSEAVIYQKTEPDAEGKVSIKEDISGLEQDLHNSYTDTTLGTYLKSVGEKVNYNYPVLATSQFDKMPYTKPSTELYVITADSPDGLVDDSYQYYTYHSTSTETKVKLIPNLTVLKSVGEVGSGNYLVTRGLNFGYNTLNDATVTTNKYTNEAFITSLGSGICVNFNGNVLKNIDLTNCNLIGSIEGDNPDTVEVDPATITNAVIDTVKLTNSLGLVGTNRGIIEAITIQGAVAISDASHTTITFGVVASENAGTIRYCDMLGEIAISELTQVTNLTFGGVAGTNSGKITNTKLNGGKIELDTSKEITVKVGGIVGESSGNISSCGVLGFEINIITTGVLKVGGIVGVSTGGTIETCYTNQYTRITAGTEEKQYGETYYATPTTYAGGIVGFNSSKLLNCENQANVTAAARWQRVGSGQKYKYVENPSNSIYVYMQMKSEAYAGGISGNGIGEGSDFLSNHGTIKGGFEGWKPVYRIATNDQPTTEELNRKKAHGIGAPIVGGVAVAGGAVITTVLGVGGLAAAAIESFGAAIFGFAATSSTAGPIGWIVAGGILIVGGIVAICLTAGKNKEAQEMADTANLYFHPMEGNSTNIVLQTPDGERQYLNTKYHNATSFEKVDSAGSTCDDIHQKVIHYDILTVDGDSDSKATKKLVRKFLQNEHAKEVRKVVHKGIVESKIYDYNGLDYSDLMGAGEQVLIGINYDVICPSRTDGSIPHIYSTTLNYTDLAIQTTSVEKNVDGDNQKATTTNNVVVRAVRSSNVINEALSFIPKSGYYDTGSKCTTHTTHTVGGTFKDICPECNNKPDSTNWKEAGATNSLWNDNGYLKNAAPDVFKVQESTITLRDAKYWVNLVETINCWFNGTLTDAAGTPIGGIDKPLTVNIELAGDQNKINVGFDQIEQFMGTFNVLPNQNGGKVYFENIKYMMNPVNNAEERAKPQNIGLIHNVLAGSTTTISGVNFDGHIEIVENAGNDIADIKNINLATIVAEVNAGAELGLNEINVNVKSVQIQNIVMFKLINLGGIVAINHGDVGLNNVNINIDQLVALTDIKSGSKAAGDLYCFGGVVANNTSTGAVGLMSVNVDLNNVQLRSDINVAGGIIGNNSGEAGFGMAVNVYINTLSVMGTGDVYVAGAVAKNNGTLQIEALNINTMIKELKKDETETNSYIYADVLDNGHKAYAGGIVGRSETAPIIKNAKIGTSAKTGRTAIIYILAGFNNNNEFSVSQIPPTEAYAGKVIGYCGETFEAETETVNVVARANSYGTGTKVVEQTAVVNSTNIDVASYGYTVSGNTISYDSGETPVYDNNGKQVGTQKSHIQNSSSYQITSKKSYYDYTGSATQGVRTYEIDLKFTNAVDILLYEYDSDSSSVVKTSEVKYNYDVCYKILITKQTHNIEDTSDCSVRIILTQTLNDDRTPKTCYEEVYSNRIPNTGNMSIGQLNPLLNGLIAVSTDNQLETDASGNPTGGQLINTTTTLKSTGFTIEFMDGDTLFELKETISLTSQTETYYGDDPEGTRSTATQTQATLDRTICSINMASDYDNNNFVKNDSYSFENGNNYEVYDGEGNPSLTGSIDKETVINGYVIPAVGVTEDRFDVYSQTMNGRNVKIFSTVDSSNSSYYLIKEYIFEYVDAEGTANDGYAFRGTISYKLQKAPLEEGKTMLDKFDDAGIFRNRAESFVSNFKTGSGEELIDYMNYISEFNYDILPNSQVTVLTEAYVFDFVPAQYKYVVKEDGAYLSTTTITYSLTKDGSITETPSTAILEKVETTEITHTVMGYEGYHSSMGISCNDYYKYGDVIVAYRQLSGTVEETDEESGETVTVNVYKYYYFNGGTSSKICVTANGKEGEPLKDMPLKFYKIVVE